MRSWKFVVPVLVIVLFVTGLATVVEAAASAFAYAIVVECFITRDIHPVRDLPRVLLKAGVLCGSVGPRGLEKARLRLLGLLHGTFAEESSTVTVVFDAAAAPPGVAPETDHKGIHVIFAVGKQEADDVIERLIRRSSAPKSLHVISDDHRVQQAARRRHCAD